MSVNGICKQVAPLSHSNVTTFHVEQAYSMESPLMIGQQPIQCNRTAMKSSLIPQAMTYTNQPALDLTI